MRHWGIRARVLFVALVPSVLILVALLVYFTYARIAEVDATLSRHGVSVARQLAPGAEFALFAGDRVALQRMADAAAKEADVASVTITDAQGRVLAQSRRDAADSAGERVQFTHAIHETRLASENPEQLQDGDRARVVGTITVAMTRAGAIGEQRRLLLSGMAVGLGGLVVATLLAMLIGDSVVRPIRLLAAAMLDLGRGRRAAPLGVSGGGELRTLQEGFNEMSSRLHASRQELQARIEEATRALSAERDAAQQATAAKSRFIAAASHDLRQPLHAIGLFTGTLERRARATDLEPVVGDLSQAVAVMDRLFDSLLDISKLDARTVRAESRPIPLARLFVQLEAEHLESAARKDLSLRFPVTDAIVLADELLLHRLLGNLVANAIRYTDEGSVMVCARRSGDNVRLEVRDSGIGISRDQQDEIFREFYQVGNPARDRSLGLGLGLAIVSRIARLLGTEVKVRSEPMRGSVFHLRLPRAAQNASAAGPSGSTPPQREAAARPRRVLVIDDDRLVLYASRALLEELGCSVTTVADEDEAQAALASSGDEPVLVLCDLWLSDERSGIALLQRLGALTRLPIYGILISGDTRPETIQAARTAGFVLLHKPVAPARMRATLMHFAARHGAAEPNEPDDEDPGR